MTEKFELLETSSPLEAVLAKSEFMPSPLPPESLFEMPSEQVLQAPQEAREAWLKAECEYGKIRNTYDTARRRFEDECETWKSNPTSTNWLRREKTLTKFREAKDARNKAQLDGLRCLQSLHGAHVALNEHIYRMLGAYLIHRDVLPYTPGKHSAYSIRLSLVRMVLAAQRGLHKDERLGLIETKREVETMMLWDE